MQLGVDLDVLLIILLDFCVLIQCAVIAGNPASTHIAATSTAEQGDSSQNGLPVLPYFNVDTCTVRVGPEPRSIIDLSPLALADGIDQFEASYNDTGPYGTALYRYAFNPCSPFTITCASGDAFGNDDCKNVSVCKYEEDHDTDTCVLFALGTPSSDPTKVNATYLSAAEVKTYQQAQKKVLPKSLLLSEGYDDVTGGSKSPSVALKYTKKVTSRKDVETNIRLVCAPHLIKPQDASFTILSDSHGVLLAELRHACCCPGVCLPEDQDRATESLGEDGNTSRSTKKGYMVEIVGTVVSVILVVCLVACLCSLGPKHLPRYSKILGLGHADESLISRGSTSHRVQLPNIASLRAGADFRDYEPSAVATARRKLIPLLADPKLPSTSVDMQQRLGGGCFSDTHLAKWKEVTVAVKRLTLSIHDNQITTEIIDALQEEVWTLSRLRHKHIVCVLGLSIDGRLPFLLTEFVQGECLKDFLRSNGRSLIWPQRIRLCIQISEGMMFLHSTKPPIIHRDLRCGNIFISDQDNTVKVADFGLTKLVQPIRERCSTKSDDCGCQYQTSACPASIRWTAPELLAHPTTVEGASSYISTACDIYSFAMVMLEMVTCNNPFSELRSEAEVIEIVKNSGRPELAQNQDMLPPYRDLMKTCWDHRPSFRPAFKQVTAKLKEMVGAARTHQKHLHHRQRHPKSLANSTDTV